jgi:hypothetical protein
MNDELPEIDGVLITCLIKAYLEQEGYKFENSENCIEYVMADKIELFSGNGTEVTIPIGAQSLQVSAEPYRVKD